MLVLLDSCAQMLAFSLQDQLNNYLIVSHILNYLAQEGKA